MSTLTARIDPHLFEETKKIAQKNGIKLSEYVRVALKLLNEKNRKMARYKQLQRCPPWRLKAKADSPR